MYYIPKLSVGAAYQIFDSNGEPVAIARIFVHNEIHVFFEPDGKAAANNPLSYDDFVSRTKQRKWTIKRIYE